MKTPEKLPPLPQMEQSRETKIGLLKARIVFFRDMGIVDYVAQMERELAHLEAAA